jgi:hypothetical protein
MRFGYLRDPLFLACLVLYLVNRFVLKPFTSIEFFHSYLNDLICIPFWVPIMLFLLRKVGLRREDGPPEAHEVLIPLIGWAYFFEVYLPGVPRFQGLAIADPADVFFYAAGALLASMFWMVRYQRSPDAGVAADDDKGTLA